jgi:hypothetical protein
MLPENVIGIAKELWDLVRKVAGERSSRIYRAKSYNFEEINQEKLADKRVLIRHDPEPSDGLWFEKVPMNKDSFWSLFGKFFKNGGNKVTVNRHWTEKVFSQIRQPGVYWLEEEDHDWDNAILQRHYFFTDFHTDSGSGSCRSPAGLKGIKIWIIIPFKKCLNGKHLLLSTANFREEDDPQLEYLKAVVSNEDVDVIFVAPGETVVFRAGDLHMVLTVYPEGTPANEQLAIVNGKHWISRWDLESGLFYTSIELFDP